MEMRRKWEKRMRRENMWLGREKEKSEGIGVVVGFSFLSFLPPRVGSADADRVRGKYVLDREKL